MNLKLLGITFRSTCRLSSCALPFFAVLRHRLSWANKITTNLILDSLHFRPCGLLITMLFNFIPLIRFIFRHFGLYIRSDTYGLEFRRITNFMDLVEGWFFTTSAWRKKIEQQDPVNITFPQRTGNLFVSIHIRLNFYGSIQGKSFWQKFAILTDW